MTIPRVFCITGCSSGLGLALAQQCAARGDVVYAGLRKPEDAARLPCGIRPLAMDVTDVRQVEEAVRTVHDEAGRLDVLISNAGSYASGPWELTPDSVVRHVFEVNFFGAVALARAALPQMRRERAGTLVFVSSLSGLVGLPADGAYAASKFALEGFAESLSYEVSHWGIRVLIVNPAGYATALHSKAWRPEAARAGDYRPLIDKLAASAGTGDPGQAATAILAAVDARNGPLRHPLDALGRRVFATLGVDAQEQRADLVRDASGLGWWSNPVKDARQ